MIATKESGYGEHIRVDIRPSELSSGKPYGVLFDVRRDAKGSSFGDEIKDPIKARDDGIKLARKHGVSFLFVNRNLMQTIEALRR